MRYTFILVSILFFGCTKSDSDLDEKFSKEGSANFEYYEGLSSYNIQFDGLNREYLLYIPPNIQSRTNLPVFVTSPILAKSKSHLLNINLAASSDPGFKIINILSWLSDSMIS